MKFTFIGLITLFMSLNTSSQEFQSPWLRSMPKNSPVSAGYVKIINKTNKPFKLTKAESSIAERVEIHSHFKVNGKMKMVEIPFLEIPAHSDVELKPGSYHLMLFNLKNDIVAGQKYNLELYINDEKKIIAFTASED